MFYPLLDSTQWSLSFLSANGVQEITQPLLQTAEMPHQPVINTVGVWQVANDNLWLSATAHDRPPECGSGH